VGRQHGNVVAALSILPYALLWAIVAYAAWFGSPDSLQWQDRLFFGPYLSESDAKPNKVLAVLIALGIIPLAYFCASTITPAPSNIIDHFDKRGGCALGVRWYHFLWIPFVMVPVVVISITNVVYASNWLLIMWGDQNMVFSLWEMVPALFLLATYGTLYLLAVGPYRAYLVLSGFEDKDSRGAALSSVLGYGVGFPIIAVILQELISLLHRFLLWLAT
jgi:hypothetical protein